MGARGPDACVRKRGVHKNRLLPNAYRTDITEFSHPYYDLCLGDRSAHGPFWPDPFCDERREAWVEWRDKIRARFPFDWSNGSRPSGWVDFELPPLLEAAVKSGRFTQEAIDEMLLDECVYHFDADEHERQAIERGWAHRVQYSYGADDVPRWFRDQVSPPAKVAPMRRRRA